MFGVELFRRFDFVGIGLLFAMRFLVVCLFALFLCLFSFLRWVVFVVVVYSFVIVWLLLAGVLLLINVLSLICCCLLCCGLFRCYYLVCLLLGCFAFVIVWVS